MKCFICGEESVRESETAVERRARHFHCENCNTWFTAILDEDRMGR